MNPLTMWPVRLAAATLDITASDDDAPNTWNVVKMGIIRMLTTPERAQRYAERATELSPWIVKVAVVLAVLPGVPTAVVYAMAGLARMRLVTFLILDLVGALLMTGLVAGLGYGLGQRAVDVVPMIDKYATAVSLTLIAATLLLPVIKNRMSRRRASIQPKS